MIVPKTCIPWIEKQRTRKIDFQKTVERDFELIRKYLPEKCNHVLDIGCGIGGIDVLLSKFYKPQPRFHLFDFPNQSYEYNKKIQYGFNDKYYGYNSFDQTTMFMKANGVHAFNLIDATRRELPCHDIEYEIIISLLSCGYHYPVSEYIEGIVDLINPKGVLFLDIRENTDGKEIVEKYFKNVKIIASENKADKIAAWGIKW